jgi:uncharacterized phiE125 gp8 family phage protein
MARLLKTPRRTTVAGEIISLETARLHLKLDTYGFPAANDDDALVSSLIVAAREAAESFTGLTIAPGTFELALDSWTANGIELQTWPVGAISSITYLDNNAAQQTLSALTYMLDNEQRPAAVYTLAEWPTTASRRNAIRVTFTAGFTDGQSPNPRPAPRSLVQAMLLMIGNWYESREATSEKARAEVPMAAEFLLQQHRINQGV